MLHLFIVFLLSILCFVLFWLGYAIAKIPIVGKEVQQQIEGLPEPEEVSMADIMNDPAFLRFMNDNDFVKNFIGVGLLSSIWMDEQLIELTINNSENHRQLIDDAIKNSYEISIVYELDNSETVG